MYNRTKLKWVSKQATYSVSVLIKILLGCMQTDATTPKIVAPTMLGVVASVLAMVCNGCNNFQQCWDLQCIVGRIQPIILCDPCIMSVRGPNNVGRVVQTDPTLLRYASAIYGTKEMLGVVGWKVWPGSNFAQQHATTSNWVCKRTQHVTSNHIGSCWSTMLCPFARSLTHFKRGANIRGVLI